MKRQSSSTIEIWPWFHTTIRYIKRFSKHFWSPACLSHQWMKSGILHNQKTQYMQYASWMQFAINYLTKQSVMNVCLSHFSLLPSRFIKRQVTTWFEPRLAVLQWFEAAYRWSIDTNKQQAVAQSIDAPSKRTPQYICPTFVGGVRHLSWGGSRTPEPPWQISNVRVPTL